MAREVEYVCSLCGGREPGDTVNPLRPPCYLRHTFAQLKAREWITADQYERSRRPATLALRVRVRLTVDVCRYPHFIAKAGRTGTVVALEPHLIAVRMDEPLPGAEEWDNEVCWTDDEDGFPGCVLDQLEILGA